MNNYCKVLQSNICTGADRNPCNFLHDNYDKSITASDFISAFPPSSSLDI